MKLETIAAIACAAAMAHGATVKHVIKPARFTRGNTAILPVQPIDQAAWLSHPDIKDEVAYPHLPRIVRFRCEFENATILRSMASLCRADPIAARSRTGCTRATACSWSQAST